MITDCFVIIDGYFTAEQAVEFINNWGRHPEFYHFGLGTRIRNELLLPGSALYLEFCRHGVSNINRRFKITLPIPLVTKEIFSTSSR